MSAAAWFLTVEERGNDATALDRRHAGGLPFTSGNDVVPLVHGAAYFAALRDAVDAARSGDLVLFTDWRGDPDQQLDEGGAVVSLTLQAAAARGVLVRGLIWRSHLDRFTFSEQENRHLGEGINKSGGQCVLDMRVRPGGSHHQKFVVVRHPGRPDLDVAFIGGIDLCHSRRDDEDHAGDVQRQAMAAVYGERPPWHDVQVAIRGPAVGDVETAFRERWNDPAAPSRNPVNFLSEVLHGDERSLPPLPRQLPDVPARGTCAVQLLRTAPPRRPPYPFAPNGEFSVARGLRKAIARASSLIYIENQYLWSASVVQCLADALRDNPDLRVIAVIPQYPDQDGRWSCPPNFVGVQEALMVLDDADAAPRLAVYGLENEAGTPIYVHAKVCIIDDLWASIGSDNLNRRSWTHDSELSCAVIDDVRDEREPRVLDRFGDGARRFARSLRLELAREHLGLSGDAIDDLADPLTMFNAFVSCADALDAWHVAGRVGPRPTGRLRRQVRPNLSKRTRAWASPVYRLVYDPDGRRRAQRHRNLF